MGWQTSRGFVTSRERIQRIDDIPDISGYQTTGAEVKYADKDDFPALASLTEGAFAADFGLIKNNELKKMLIPGISNTSGIPDSNGDTVDMKSRSRSVLTPDAAIMGVLARGKSDGSNAANAALEENDTLIFWYNGNWNIVKKDTIKDEYIPVELAVKVIASANLNVDGILNQLSKVKLNDTDYDSVSSRSMASLMGMEAELYSKWEFNGQLHIMLNTDMQNGPYQFKRTGGNIFITFYPEFRNKNDSDFKAVPVAGLAQTTMGSYFTAIKTGFERWGVRNPPKSENETAGLGDYTINVTAKIDEVNRSKKKTNVIDVINTYEPYSRNIQISNVYAPGWKINNVGKLTMYSFYENDTSTYDAEGYRNMAAHEFGHLLGIGDAYEENLDGTPKIRLTGEVPVDDLMRGGKTITYNDIEMVFLAALKNQKQEFDLSEAITEVTQ